MKRIKLILLLGVLVCGMAIIAFMFFAPCSMGPPDRKWTPLHYAAKDNDVSRIKELIDQGASINVLDKCGESPLSIAASHGSKEAAEFLIQSGANINSGRNGFHPVQCAAMHGNAAIVDLLVRNGADIYGKDAGGYTILHAAACSGSACCTKQAIDLGVDVNARNSINQTPLHLAAGLNHPKVVKILLEHGADPSVSCDEKGRESPLFIAKQRRHKAVVRLLTKAIEQSEKATTHLVSPPYIEMEVKGDDSVMLAGKKIPEPHLQQKLRNECNKHGQIPVYLSVHPTLNYSRFVSIVDQCAEAGFWAVYIGYPSGSNFCLYPTFRSLPDDDPEWRKWDDYIDREHLTIPTNFGINITVHKDGMLLNGVKRPTTTVLKAIRQCQGSDHARVLLRVEPNARMSDLITILKECDSNAIQVKCYEEPNNLILLQAFGDDVAPQTDTMSK